MDPNAVDAALKKAKKLEARGIVIPEPKIKISDVTNNGIVKITFNQPMLYPKTIDQDFYKDLFDFSII